jgi:hypothetical protein
MNEEPIVCLKELHGFFNPNSSPKCGTFSICVYYRGVEVNHGDWDSVGADGVGYGMSHSECLHSFPLTNGFPNDLSYFLNSARVSNCF